VKVINVSDGLILSPINRREILSLWFLSFFAGSYEKTIKSDAYPVKRRVKFILTHAH